MRARVVVAGLLLLCCAASGAPALQATGTPRALIELADRTAPQTVPEAVAAAFEAATPGHWELEWDARTAVLGRGRRGWAPPGPRLPESAFLERAQQFLDRHAASLGARAPLELVRAERAGAAWHATWQQTASGKPVFGATLDLVLVDSGEVVAFVSSLVPDLQTAPATRLPVAAQAARVTTVLGRAVRIAAAEEGVAVVPDGEAWQARPATRLDLWSGHGERWEALVDGGSGEVLALDSRICEAVLQGSVSARVQPLYADEEPLERPLPWLHLDLGVPPLRATSDALGHFAFEVPGPGSLPLAARLRGRWVDVVRDGAPSPGFAATVAVPGDVAVHFDDAQAGLDERTIYVHTNIVHDFVATRFGFHLLDFPLPAVAAARNPATGDPNYANAYWDGEGIHFGNGASAFHNFGLFADVIYHEYTHAVTEYMYKPFGRLGGVYGGGIHEALADYFACTITNEPEVGERLFRDGIQPHLRTLENNLRWPEDATFEAHADGAIFGGALWDLRRLVGPTVADPLVHFARAHGPRAYETYVEAILLEDDLQFGDGQAGNGSPHRAAILTAFGSHGFGPAAGSGRQILHRPLGDTEDPGRSRLVEATFEGSLSSGADTLYLHYTPLETFERVLMQRQANGGFRAEIPGAILPEGTTIRYYITLAGHGRVPAQTHPPGAPEATHEFRVGPDQESPHIEHVPISSAAALAWPCRIVTHIHDNLGVANAWVEFSRNGNPESMLGMQRSSTDDSQFTTQFPFVGGLGDVIAYRVLAADASRSRLQAVLPESGWFEFTIVSTLRESFDSGSGAWQHASLLADRPDPWHWSFAANHTPGGSHALSCGNPAGEYPTRVAAALDTELYPVGAGASARIWSLMDAEQNGPLEAFDGGVVQVEVDASGTWSPIVPDGGYTHVLAATAGQYLPPGTPCLSGRSPSWQQLRFDLSAYAGHRIRLRFLFTSDAVATPFGLGGWALDDFDLEPGTLDATDVEAATSVPRRLLRAPPAPNPFNPSVAFALEVPRDAGPLRLALFDARGRLARTVWHGVAPAGALRLTWDGTGEAGVALPSGVYYYRLESRLGAESGTIVLVR